MRNKQEKGQKLKLETVALLIVLLLTSSSGVLIFQRDVSAHTPPQSVDTQAFISVSPNPLGIGQTATIIFGLSIPPPTANGTYGDRWINMTIKVSQPDDTTLTLGPFSSDETGKTYTVFTPTQIGSYTFQMHFGGQVLKGLNLAPGTTSSSYPEIGDYYQPSSSDPFTITVQAQPIEPTPTPTNTPTPSPTPTPMPWNSISVTLLSPNNNKAIPADTNVSFVYRPFSYGASRFYGVDLVVNGAVVASNQSTINNGGNNTIYYKFPASGQYTWNIRVQNETSIVYADQDFHLTVGYVQPTPSPPPQISNVLSVILLSPNTNSIISDSRDVSFVYLPVVTGSSGLVKADVYVNNIPVASNQSTLLNGVNNTINYRFPENGNYVWNIRVRNQSGFAFASYNFNLVIASAEPTLTPTAQPTTTPTISPTATPSPSRTPSPIPTSQPKPEPTINMICHGSTSSTFKVDIIGTITYNGEALPDAQILLSYSVTAGKTWVDLTTTMTNAEGGFSEVWLPQVSGAYLLKAVYLGSSDYSQTSEVVSFAVTPYQEQTVFSVTSNSTVTSLSFNSSSQEISFTVNGTTGTTGYVSIYVPKSLVSDASNLKVLLDGEPVAYTATATDDSILVTFTYHHSTHQVAIKVGEQASQSQGIDQSILIAVVAVLAAVIMAICFAVAWQRKKLQH